MPIIVVCCLNAAQHGNPPALLMKDLLTIHYREQVIYVSHTRAKNLREYRQRIATTNNKPTRDIPPA